MKKLFCQSLFLFCLFLPAHGQNANLALKASDGTSTNNISLTWNEYKPGHYYQVFRGDIRDLTRAKEISEWQTNRNFTDGTSIVGKTYYYWIKIVNKIGNPQHAFSYADAGYRAPIAPQNLTKSIEVVVNTKVVRLTWKGQLGYYYRVYRRPTEDVNNINAINPSWQTSTTFDDASATDGRSYTYWVVASTYNNGTNPSAPSATIIATTAGNPPSNINASQGSSTEYVEVNWYGTWDSYFTVYRNAINDPKTATQLSPQWQFSVTFQDKTAIPGTIYYYWVQSGNAQGQYRSPLQPSANTGFRAIPPPVRLTVSRGTFPDKLRLTWQKGYSSPPVNPITYYRVYGSNDSKLSNPIPISNWITATTYDDFILRPATYYYYVIASAYPNGDRPSQKSNGDGGYRKSNLLESELSNLPNPNPTELDRSKLSLSLSPNPTTKEIKLDFYLQEEEIISFSVFDMSGKRVLRFPEQQFMVGSQSTTFNVEQLPSGEYVFLFNAKSTRVAQKFIKQ